MNNGFYVGVVESIEDPLKIGRLKVRVKGVHADSDVQIPTADLPWAAPMHPITSAAHKGIGIGGVGVVIGTQVVCFFRDPGRYQEPVVVGTLPGLFHNEEATDSNIREKKESDFGRIATNNMIDKTLVKVKKDRVQEAKGGPVDFKEPETPYNAKYGMDSTYTSKSGHVFEIDDTESAERIHIWHKSGTFIEIHPDGKTVVRSEGDTFEINKKTLNVYVETDRQEFIGGDLKVNINGNANVNIGGNAVLQVAGNQNTTVGGNYTVAVSGNYKLTAARIDLN